MRKRLLTVALAIVPVTLAACSDAPTETRAVRLAVQHTKVPGAQHGGQPLSTPMTQEVTHSPSLAVGDPDGTGTALITINLGQRELCWELTVSNILPATAAHIHRGVPDARGPVVVPLSAPGANGSATGCALDVSRALLEEILATPEAFYANVHTSDFPLGAVRGQLK
jgi:hypothetical protein